MQKNPIMLKYGSTHKPFEICGTQVKNPFYSIEKEGQLSASDT